MRHRRRYSIREDIVMDEIPDYEGEDTPLDEAHAARLREQLRDQISVVSSKARRRPHDEEEKHGKRLRRPA